MERAGEIESRFYYFPGQNAQNTKIDDRAHALHITTKAWTDITKHLDRKDVIQQTLDKEKAHKKALKDGSEAMTKLWPNSIENIRLRKEREKEEELRRKDEEKGVYYFQLRKEQEKLRDDFLAKVKRKMLTATGPPRDLTSALVLSETLYERQKQIEFNEMIKNHEDAVEAKYAEKVKKDAEDEKREKIEEKVKTLEKNKRYGKLLMKQIEERENVLKDDNKKRVERLAIDIQKAQEEQKLMEELEHKEKIEKRRFLRNGIKNDIEDNKRRQKVLEKEDREMEEATKLYAVAKSRIDCMMKVKEKEDRAKAVAARVAIAEKVAAVVQEKEGEENARLARAIAEKDAADAENVRLKEEQRQQGIRDRIADREQYLKRKEIEKKKDQEEMKWKMLNRCKTMEVMKQSDNQNKNDKWQAILEYRKELLEQIADNKELARQETELEKLISIVSFEKYDKEFFDYAEEVLNLAKRRNRPVYPIEKVIMKYKKDKGLVNKERQCQCCKKHVETNACIEI